MFGSDGFPVDIDSGGAAPDKQYPDWRPHEIDGKVWVPVYTEQMGVPQIAFVPWCWLQEQTGGDDE